MRRFFRHGLLPQLIAFEACVRLGGVTRAAEELSLAQPTISGLLRKLSDTVGAPLLVARGRRIELTQEGVRVLALCGEVLDSLARFEKDREAEATRPSSPRSPSSSAHPGFG